MLRVLPGSKWIVGRGSPVLEHRGRGPRCLVGAVENARAWYSVLEEPRNRERFDTLRSNYYLTSMLKKAQNEYTGLVISQEYDPTGLRGLH